MSFARSYSFPLALAALLGATACSSSKPAGDASTGNPDILGEPSAQSSADQVGSVPEDMLGDEKATDTADATPNPEATPADPFGDLKKKEETASAPDDSEQKELAAEPSQGSGQTETYTVRAGDTLMKVAFQIYGDVDRWKDLREQNEEALKSGTGLRKGMKLRYEAPAEAFQPEQLSHSYQIKKGDTLAGIADDVYGRKGKYKKLQAYNKKLIKNPNRIFAGFTIYYDITEKEMAEAEAHRAQKTAGGDTAPAASPAAVPSALSPPAPAPTPNVAVTPQATDNSAVPGPGAQPGPPAPVQQ